MAEADRPCRALQPNIDRYRGSLLTVGSRTVCLGARSGETGLRGALDQSHALDPTGTLGWRSRPAVTPHTYVGDSSTAELERSGRTAKIHHVQIRQALKAGQAGAERHQQPAAKEVSSEKSTG